MFENSMTMAVLAASDLERAQRFWHDVFGLDPVSTDMGGATYVVGGVGVLVYESEFAGTNRATALAIMTDDLDRDMAELRSKGVVFHDYDMPGLKTENGVVEQEGERGAWFDDSEGNILSIAQPTAVSLDQAREMLAAASA
ncbi:VOC family protein [Agromyces kandeliae]|uniref:VOC family protein n=1 Tax=Agromyces kandeliae TaxID=2666141 RepID=A0A6L5QYW0_9MICO|nr:VOC family protein [Agromyces kandeliae]MRX42843.1 VOC family protein [Agromyces kandeliae]